jgi:hypothetical protein
VLWRTAAMGVAGGSVSALMPIVARDLLGGDARVYGLILGAFGIGAVSGALVISAVRERLPVEVAVRLSALLMAGMVSLVALSSSLLLTAAALVLAGIAWMVSITLFNISVQLSAPRWVVGRTLAGFQAAIAGGVAIGSWIWGQVAESHGVSAALLASSLMLALTPLLALRLRMPPIEDRELEPVDLGTVETRLALTGRSGPIVVEIEYRVAPTDARAFYGAMQEVQSVRHRNGAYDWSIARDIADPELWTERFHFPTWHDYLRHRTRHTAAELHVQEEAERYHRKGEPVRVRRMLERPFGSVRWREDAPDPVGAGVLPLPSAAG